jgi:hypothetical protein
MNKNSCRTRQSTVATKAVIYLLLRPDIIFASRLRISVNPLYETLVQMVSVSDGIAWRKTRRMIQLDVWMTGYYASIRGT